jgi:biotin carboxylase
MAHLLIIENWVEGTGRLLPKNIHELGHSYTFVTRNKSHYLDSDTQKIHPVLAYADNVLTTETNDIDKLTEFLQGQHQLLHFDGVSTICDYYVDTVAQVAKALELPQAFSSNVVKERRKHLVREALRDFGLANPKYAVCHDWPQTAQAAQDIGYPLILKPSDLASSAFVQLIKNEQQLKTAFEQLAQFTHNFRDQAREPLWLLEEFMSGDEVSVEAVTYQGKTTVIGITDKSLVGYPYFIEDGHMFPAKLDTKIENQVREFVCQTLEAVGHDHGISHSEVKLTKDGPRLVEINPRPGGNYIAELIELVTGINFLEMHINLALNREPDLSGLIHAKGSAAVKFIVPQIDPKQQGTLTAIHGQNQLEQNPHLTRWHLNEVTQQTLFSPIDNACYLGHVISRDENGFAARDYAEQAIDALKIEIVTEPSKQEQE